MKEQYTIIEYGGFTEGEGKANSRYQHLDPRQFAKLEAFILANRTQEDGSSPVELLSLSARGGKKRITAKNYVGLVELADGTSIEILPKIAGCDIAEGEAEETKKQKTNTVKKIFLGMLKSLRKSPFAQSKMSHLDTENKNILEIFIAMFIGEASRLAMQGLKSDYFPVEGNERFLKGKLLFSQHIKANALRKERFFVQYDEFGPNRPENRLIKSTLGFLLKKTRDAKNRQGIARLLPCFADVADSKNHAADFAKCTRLARNMLHYEKALSWCRVFLGNSSFTAFSGKETAFALLFPMEKIFESFIAEKFRKHIDPANGDKLCVQDSRHALVESPEPAFKLRPDLVLVLEGKDRNSIVVFDTKWKCPSGEGRNKGIAPADMYQMHAYSKKYVAEHIFLIYPKTEGMEDIELCCENDNFHVHATFIDLANPDEGIERILDNSRQLGQNA